MKELTAHQINECNSAIRITADEPDPSNGNSSHVYEIARTEGRLHFCTLSFQHGPILEVGTNGITHEVLLAVLIDRLEGFQSGKYASEYNARALHALREAQTALHDRTKERVVRGVEGTHQL